MRSLILGSLTNINSQQVDIISVQCYGTDPVLFYPCLALSFQLLSAGILQFFTLRPFMFFLTVQRAIRKARKKRRKRRNKRNTRRRKTKNTNGRLTAAHHLPLLLGRLDPTLFGGH